MQRANRRCALAHFLFFLAARYPFGGEIDDEDRHSTVACIGIGAGKDIAIIGDGSVVDPYFGAGKTPVRAVPPGGGFYARNIRAGLSLGDAIAHPLAHGEDVGKIHLALGLGSMHREKRADQLHEAALVGHRGIAARKLFHDKGIGEGIKPCTAEVLRNRDPEKAELRHFLVELGGKGLRFIKLGGAGAYPVAGKAPGRIMDVAVNIRRQPGHGKMKI